ncbi:PelD GGDEF domain-containing protein [Herbaspirillum lusitanum]|uniref:PelD GGDEF domain-containing protein n=1 Tax=Herbaspirillum lusitanum TaxID=213312 RepID=A0ABW9AC77_9BURK
MSKSDQTPPRARSNSGQTAATPAADFRRRFWRRLFARIDTDGASPRAALWRGVESIVFVLLTLLLSQWIAPEDPFGIRAEFPWIWMVPAILAMRYGSAIGVVSVLTLVAGWYGLAHWHLVGVTANMAGPAAAGAGMQAPEVFPQVYFLGGLVLTLLCGQFAEVWNARSRRLRAINAYLDERLTMLTKNHFLLRLSHERLEQDLLSKPLTLRESLDRMRALTLDQNRHAPARLPAAEAFLQILVQSCQLEVASVHACDEQRQISPTPAATLGKTSEFSADDPLVRHSLEFNKLAHVQSEAISQSGRNQSRYLICAPLRNFDGELFGLLLVEKLPFVALNEDALQLLSVLIDYYADGIEMGLSTRAVLQQVPECPPQLAVDMVRLHHLKRSTDIDSSLVALVFGDDETSRDMFEQVRRLKRAADVIWSYRADGRNVLISLLPLAGSAAVDGYLMRIESVSHAQFGNKFLSNFAEIHTAHLGRQQVPQLLANLVERCAV